MFCAEPPLRLGRAGDLAGQHPPSVAHLIWADEAGPAQDQQPELAGLVRAGPGASARAASASAPASARQMVCMGIGPSATGLPWIVRKIDEAVARYHGRGKSVSPPLRLGHRTERGNNHSQEGDARASGNTTNAR